ncbi:MAG: hypothetical protein ACTSPS_09570 [Promethearchaeota archaeon]
MLEQKTIQKNVIPVCKNCILYSFAGIELDSEGNCNFCADSSSKLPIWEKVSITQQDRDWAREDWNKTVVEMKENRGKQQYDCVLGWSGGKDSTSMLDYLVNKLELNPLAVSIDSGTMSDVARENVAKALQKIKVDHMLIDDLKDTFLRFFRWMVVDFDSNELGAGSEQCRYCGYLLHGLIVKEAMKRNIPYVFLGYSPDQIHFYFYEMPREEIINEWGPELEKFSTKEDAKWYIAPMNLKVEDVPRVLLPYHILPYKEDEVIKLVEDKGYVEKGNGDPLKTNCYALSAALFYEAHRFGALCYAVQPAELVRQDPSLRKKWLLTIKHFTRTVYDGDFNRQKVEEFYKIIGTTREEVLKRIEESIENDPNKHAIRRNIKWIKSNRRGFKTL